MKTSRALFLSALLAASILPFSPNVAEDPRLPLAQIPPDLEVPPIVDEPPAPGRWVREFLPEHEGGELYHLVHLPSDWEEGGRYPVIFEYPGNRYRTSPGTQEGCRLGFGLSGGEGAIWVCLPFVDPATGTHAPNWWGDVEATVGYAKRAAEWICDQHGGDRDRLFLAGFSRGAIACNYIGLHDNEIASLWRGFICHSHYDGVRRWKYEGSDEASAKRRLARLGDRPQFVSHERSVETTRAWLREAAPDGRFHFLSLPWPDHTADWVLRDVPERDELRAWFAAALADEDEAER